MVPRCPTSGVATLNPATPLGFSNAKRLSRRVCRRGWFSSMLASEIQDRFTDAKLRKKSPPTSGLHMDYIWIYIYIWITYGPDQFWMFTMMVDVAQVLGRLIHPRHHIGVLREDLDLAGENSETNRGLLNNIGYSNPKIEISKIPLKQGVTTFRHSCGDRLSLKISHGITIGTPS